MGLSPTTPQKLAGFRTDPPATQTTLTTLGGGHQQVVRESVHEGVKRMTGVFHSPVSEPRAAYAIPVATATALPPELPPLTRKSCFMTSLLLVTRSVSGQVFNSRNKAKVLRVHLGNI